MESQKGSTLLAVLVGFLIISLVMISLLKIASMERKMSANSMALLQARQAVDGGIAWASERTYSALVSSSAVEVLPALPLDDSMAPVMMGESAGRASYKLLDDGVKLVQQGSDFCVYEFGCEGSCRGIIQNASVRVRYQFEDRYHYEAGTRIFDGRTFADHGKIIYYQPLNSGSIL